MLECTESNRGLLNHDVVAAELVRIESFRFKLGLVERLIFDVVNAHTTGLGRAAMRVERNWAALADAIHRPRNHVGAQVNGPRGLVMHGVLSCVADDVGYALAVNYDFERWSYEVLASHGAHWHRHNALRRVNGCTEWLWPAEVDLNAALEATHRERWMARAAGIVARDALRFGQQSRVMSALVVPDSGAVPESGSEFGRGGGHMGDTGFTRVNIERNAPTHFREKCRSNVARARALDPIKRDLNPIGSKANVVQSLMSLEELKGKLRSGDYHDFINAARAIIGPAWEPRPEWPKGDAGKWIARWNVGGECRSLVLRLMDAMIEDGWPISGDNSMRGAAAQSLWERWGGPAVDKKLGGFHNTQSSKVL